MFAVPTVTTTEVTMSEPAPEELTDVDQQPEAPTPEPEQIPEPSTGYGRSWGVGPPW
jgi:hypothetical protein